MKILSLGCHCEPAHQLKRLGLHASSPFDWLVSPYQSVIDIIADRGVRLGIDFVSASDGTSVRCGHYDVLYHHDFERDEAERVKFSKASIEKCRSKLAHKMKRFIEVCEGAEPVLFVRVGPRADLPWEKRDIFTERHITDLTKTIESQFPNLDFELLMLARPGFGDHDLSGLRDARVRLLHSKPIPHGMLGDDSEWDLLRPALSRASAKARAPMRRTPATRGQPATAKSKKIGIIAPYAAEKGGAERAFDGLISAFLAQGMDCQLVSIPNDASNRSALETSIESAAALDLSEFDAILSTKFPAFHCRHPNHVVYLMHPMRSLYDLFESEHPDPSHETLEFRKAVIARDTRALRSARSLFAVGYESASRLMSFNGLHATVMHHPSTLKTAHDRSGDEAFLLLPGRLHPWKRVDLAIDAMRYVRSKFRLLISGTGPDETRLREKASGLNTVSFLGDIGDPDLAGLYARARATVYVPKAEDFGLVTIESFNAATPVITTSDAGEPTLFVVNGVTGLVAQPHPFALAAAFDYALAHPDQMQQFGAAARQVSAQLSWDGVAATLLSSMNLLPAPLGQLQ